MIPVAGLPGATGSRVAPIAVAIVITPAAIHPVAFDPDVAGPGRSRALIIDIGGLVGDISLHRAAGSGDTACYPYDH
jgi:hypothetical protein